MNFFQNTVEEDRGDQPPAQDLFASRSNSYCQAKGDITDHQDVEKDQDLSQVGKIHIIRSWGKSCLGMWKTIVAIAIPILLLPLALDQNSREVRCGYVVILMSLYWLIEPIPHSVTALFPVVLFPLLGVVSTNQACYPYLQETNMLFIGNLMVAVAIQNCNLHRRVALKVLLSVGTNPKCLMFGFMMTTMFLSMWICNSATTAMMMPIVDAVLEEMNSRETPDTEEETVQSGQITLTQVTLIQKTNGELPTEDGMKAEVPAIKIANRGRDDFFRKMLYISVAFAANIGGTATLTSAGPNLVLMFFNDELFESHAPIEFASWLGFAICSVVITVVLTWVIFQLMILRNTKTWRSTTKKSVVRNIRKKYEELGGMTFHECAVLTLFIILVLLWMFRDPQFARGWATYFGVIKPKDATAVMAIVILLFFIPARPTSSPPRESLITWSVIQEKLPWGIVILRGGGFSMAEATKESGLSHWLGFQLASLHFMSETSLVIVIAIMTSFLTEFVSNSATAMVLLPVVAELAVALHINPLILMIPTTLACSYAFMLPVGTPANAIVFNHANLNSHDMMLCGFFTKMLCTTVMLINLYTLGMPIFGLGNFPDWAGTTSLQSTTNLPLVNVTLPV